MQVKKLILSGLVSGAFLPVLATDWYYVGGSNDWWNAASYSTTTSPSGNTTMPGAGDLIVTRTGQKLYMDDTTVAFWNTVIGFNMGETGATLHLNLTTNATVTGCFGDIGGHNYHGNWLVKTGAGLLTFDATSSSDPNKGIYGSGTSKNCYRYDASYDVREGGIDCGTRRSDIYRSYLGSIKIAEGAVFYSESDTDGQFWYEGTLSGGGTFTNRNTGASATVYINGPADVPPTEFSGVIAGKMSIIIEHSTYLTGTHNTSSFMPAGYTQSDTGSRGVIGVKTYAGSYANCAFSTKTGAGAILFLNDEDETVKAGLTIWNSPAVFDAGTRGGITWSPSNWWGLENSQPKQQRVIFQGSNTVSSVWNGPICNNNGYPSFFVTKRGTGTWRFDNETKGSLQNTSITGLRGVFAVDEGTLEAVSLAEAGQRCSLGYADQLYEDKCDAVANLQTVPYAIRLGSPTTGEGTLSYVGTAAKEITTRPIAVQGKGRLKAPNAPYLNWSGVMGLESGVENVMTFESAAGQTNTVQSISGPLTVVKAGPGSLAVKGDRIAVSGGWVVKEGTATFANMQGQPYSWYKLIVKETAGSSPLDLYKDLVITKGNNWTGNYNRRFQMDEFGLYDADGNRLNAYQKGWAGNEVTSDWTVENLQPGQIAAENPTQVLPFSNGFDGWAWYAAAAATYFGGTYKYRAASYHWKDGNTCIEYAKPETWISVVQRLKDEDLGKTVSFDLCSETMAKWTPTAVEVQGSADGIYWDTLFTTNDYACAETGRHWMSGSVNITSENPDTRAHPKFALPRTTTAHAYTFAAPTFIEVEKGATLKLKGAAVAVDKLVANTNGVGTVEGPFAFAATGTVDIPDLPNARYVEIPAGTFVGCTGIENLGNWTLTSNGQPVRRTLEYKDGKFVITKFGLSIIVR